MIPQAIVIFSLLTGQVHFVALLDYPYQMNISGYQPGPGEARINEDRDRFVAETFVGGYPDLSKIAPKIAAAEDEIKANPTICLVGISQ